MSGPPGWRPIHRQCRCGAGVVVRELDDVAVCAACDARNLLEVRELVLELIHVDLALALLVARAGGLARLDRHRV